MNPDSQNPINPAAAAAPSLTPTPDAPTMPAGPVAVPTLDPSLLQQAINDVPDEATEGAPVVPSAVNINNLGDAPAPAPEAPMMTDPMMAAPAADFSTPSPFATAAPAADFSAPAPEAPVNPSANTAAGVPGFAEPQKTTPSVAFNDPAQAPEPQKGFKKPAFLEGKKLNPVLLIVLGGAIVIVALVLLLAFAV